MAVLAVVVPSGSSLASTDDPAPVDPEPATTVTDFYPENANLSDCVGLVERPGCGSEQRGGWRQFAILAAVLFGMGLIGWRISTGVRANRAAASDSSEQPDSPRPPPAGRNPA